MQTIQRFVTLVSLAACLTLALAGCGDKKTASEMPASSTPAATTVSSKPFQVAFNQWIGYVGLFTALDKGYFKDAGLDVQPKQFAGPADGVPPLVAGQIDVALTTADTVILLNEKAASNPASCVYIIDTSNGADGVIAQKDIKTVKDLKGKTVAATNGQCNELLLLKALAAAGMTEKDIKITNMDADTAGAAILANKVPAGVTWEPWLSKASANGAHVIYTSADAPNTLLDVVAASKTTQDTRPADLKAFVAAYAKGTDYAAAHPDEAAAIAAKHLGSTAADAKSMLTKVLMYSVPENKKLIGTPSAPGSAFKSADEISKFYVSQKQLPSIPDTSKVFITDYLP